MRDHIVRIDGRRIALRRGGQGRPVLYLHDAGADTLASPLFEDLAGDHDVAVPALPGYGDSDPPGRGQPLRTAADVASVLAGLLESLGWRQATVVGTSLGGWFALELALGHPRLVADLVLCDSAGLHTPEEYLFALFAEGRAAASAQQQIAQALLARLAPGERDIDGVPPAVMAARIGPYTQNLAAAAAMSWHPWTANPRLLGRLATAQCPTTVLWGQLDALIPMSHGQLLASSIPGARLEIVPGAGHLLALECPEIVAAAIRRQDRRHR